MNSLRNLSVRLSSWTHLFCEKGKRHIALYHSLNMELVFLQKKYQQVVELLRLGTTPEHLHKKFPKLSKEMTGVTGTPKLRHFLHQD